MRFEIPFNEKITKEQSEKYFNFVWKDFQLKNKKKIYYIIPMITIGIAIVFGKDNIGYIFIMFGLYILLNYYNHYRHHKINKEKYLKTVEKHVLEYSSNKQVSIWEFNEEQFCYCDFKYDLKIKWSSFSKFRIIEDDLILELKDNILGNFFLNKTEIGNVDFDKIIHFLEIKIKNQ